MQFDFFKGNETEQYMFYRVPQVLFTDEQFNKISCEAKLLYGFLIDRTSLSVKTTGLIKVEMCLYILHLKKQRKN